MKLLKNLFFGNKKEKEELKENENDGIINEIPEFIPDNVISHCGICKKYIFQHEKSNKFNAQRYHTKCLRKYKRQSVREFIK